MAIPNRKLPTLTPQDIERFNSKFIKGNPDECWLWLGGRHSRGYGIFHIQCHPYRANRVAYFLHYETDPAELVICHKCDNPPCVNPAHLWAGTNQDNRTDSANKGRIQHGDNHWAKAHPEKYHRGNNHYSRTNPERLARGDRHGARLHPERMPRGERHGSRTEPERCPRGERHGMTTLTEADVLMIRQMYKEKVKQVEIAKRFNITQASVSYIVLGKSWKHLL